MAKSATPSFDYRQRSPGDTVSRFVELIWYARGRVPYRRERISPTGSSVGILVFGDPLCIGVDQPGVPPVTSSYGFVIGPHDGPVVNEPQGETYALGVVTTHAGWMPSGVWNSTGSRAGRCR